MTDTFEYNHVVVIETASNQRTIFQTNRLRENIGASQLIHQVGTVFVPKAVTSLNGAARIVSAISGKATVLTKDEGAAKKLIEAVTWQTVKECAGVVARGASAPIKEASAKGLDRAIGEAHAELNRIAARLPAAPARFARLPFVENCTSSGYPASMPDPDPNLNGTVSAAVMAKRYARKPAWNRIRTAMKSITFFDTMEQFEDDAIGSDWLGIVHADGNGLGQIFLKFSSQLDEDATVWDYIAALNTFSEAIDAWTKTATEAAIKATWPDGKVEKDKQGRAIVPVIPVVLGGDDLTVICEGERAVRFAARFLREFEDASRAGLKDGMGGLLPKLKGKSLAGGAGVAIVKPHFPFHRAYHLAEELVKSAKIAKKHFGDVPCSAIDFHVLFDTSVADLDAIRSRMQGPEKERLTMRPYVVTPLDDLAGSENARVWAGRHHYDRLQKAVEAVLPKPSDDPDGDDANLPSTQAHALMHSLYQGAAVADGRLAQIEHRYEKFAWHSVTDGPEGKRSLFIPDGDGKGAYLLDAMELADLSGQKALDDEEKSDAAA